MAERVLILGGTREAVSLAARLVAEGHDVTTSLAGRTREPRPVAGTVRIGGFGGSEGLARVLADGGFDRLIDATHPFAVRISRNATAAAASCGIAFEIVQRPPWEPVAGDRWTRAADIEAAAHAIHTGARVLLALGSQHIAPFAARGDVHFVVRMVDPPERPLALPDHEIVLGRPSLDRKAEARLLRDRRIDVIVCRNSGGEGAYAKLEAAREVELPVIMVDRPQA